MESWKLEKASARPPKPLWFVLWTSDFLLSHATSCNPDGSFLNSAVFLFKSHGERGCLSWHFSQDTKAHVTTLGSWIVQPEHDQGLKTSPCRRSKKGTHQWHSQCSWKIRKTRIETYRIFSDEFQEKPPLSFGSVEGQSSSKCEGQQEKRTITLKRSSKCFLMKEVLLFGRLWILNSFKFWSRTLLTQRHVESSSALRLL